MISDSDDAQHLWFDASGDMKANHLHCSKINMVHIGDHPCSILILGSICSVIGCVKGLINALPTTVFLSIPCTLSSLWFLTPNFFSSYWILLKTPYLGPNLKTLAFLTLWIPLVCWPILVFLCSVLVGVVLGFVYPFGATFDDDKYCFLISGMAKTYQECGQWIYELVEFQRNRYRKHFLKQFESPEVVAAQNQAPAPGGVPIEVFDISFPMLAWCLIVGFACGTYCFIVCLPIFTCYLIPVTLRFYLVLWRAYFHIGAMGQESCVDIVWRIVFFLPWLVANVLLPVVCVLVYVIACLSAFFVGLLYLSECYSNGAASAFKEASKFIQSTSSNLNDLLWDK